MGYILLSIRMKKTLKLKHPGWVDLVTISAGKMCHHAVKDCAKVLKLTEDTLDIKWDRYGPDRFVRNPKTDIFEREMK